MNMLNVHMGFCNATVIDSLVIIWPRRTSGSLYKRTTE
ncbi:MAG: hypothetical protein R2942_01135 [Ignavibacteria bacterium]